MSTRKPAHTRETPSSDRERLARIETILEGIGDAIAVRIGEELAKYAKQVHVEDLAERVLRLENAGAASAGAAAAKRDVLSRLEDWARLMMPYALAALGSWIAAKGGL